MSDRYNATRDYVHETIQHNLFASNALDDPTAFVRTSSPPPKRVEKPRNRRSPSRSRSYSSHSRSPSNDSRKDRWRNMGGKRRRERSPRQNNKPAFRPQGQAPPRGNRNANVAKGSRPYYGPQGDYIQYSIPLVFAAPYKEQSALDRYRMLLGVIPLDEGLCSLHIAQPPSYGNEGGAPHTYPSAEALKAFYSQADLVPSLQEAESSVYGMHTVIDFKDKSEAIRAYLMTGPFAKIDGSVVKVGWAREMKIPVPPQQPIYRDKDVENCAMRYAEVFEGLRAGNVQTTSNADWSRYEESKYRPRAPTPPPPTAVPLSEGTPQPLQQFTATASSNGAPSSYLPSNVASSSKLGLLPEVVRKSRAQQLPARSKGTLREELAPRTLLEAHDYIRFNRTVLQLTTAIEPLLNYEESYGVHCDAPMFALPFADERAVYEMAAVFGEITNIVFTPDKRSVFITYAKFQSVAAAVAKARQANWIESGVRASALGHSLNKK